MVYQYDALPPGRWFRLLRIYPGQQDDPLRCEMISTAMADAPGYTALSYVWGDPTNIGHVTCSGIETPVTLSLLGGLRQLRHTDKLVLAWADAICINQVDVKEKGNQVNMMGIIYDRAAEVLVWLGNDPMLLANHAFRALPGVNTAVVTKTHRSWYDSEYSLELGFEEGKSRTPVRVSRSNMASLLDEKQVEAIKQLYQLPWFTRVWVLQEIGLATKATACWGNCRIDFSEIALFVWFAMNEHDVQKQVGPEVRAIISGCPYYAVYSVWSTYGKGNSWIQASQPLKIWADHLAKETNIDFVLVLEASRLFSATDARDHVFAFLGHPSALLPGNGESLVKADYELDLERLYYLVAQRLAATSLNFLVQAQNTTETLARGEACPSWIPRWDSSLSDAPAAFWEAWDASLRVSKHTSYPLRICDKRLIVSALMFDTVQFQTDVMRSSDFDHDTGKIGFWIEECWNLTERAAETFPHKYQENHLLAFVSVLQCNYVSKTTDTEAFAQKTITDFFQACVYFNNKFCNEKLLRSIFRSKLPALQHRNFAAQFKHYGTNRRFFVTKTGYWGLGPATMQEGDVCAVLLGADVPFLLRPVAEERSFQLVGQLYVFGAMYGEIIQRSDAEEGLAEEEITIV